MNPSLPDQQEPRAVPSAVAAPQTSGNFNGQPDESAVEAARATAEDLRDQGRETIADIKDAGADVAMAVQDKAEDLAERGKQAGAERGEGLAGATRRVADDLEATSPEIARHIRSAADSISEVSASLRDRSVGDLLHEVEGFARRQPAAFFGAAVLAGFAITRFAKSSKSGAADSQPPTTAGAAAAVQPARAPGWVPNETVGTVSGAGPVKPATMPAATLGGAAAHQPGTAAPGSMPTIQGSAS